MVRLIDADALIESLTINPTECMGCPEPEWIDEFIQVLNTAPSVLINCIQCEHYYETEDDNGVVGHCKIDTAHIKNNHNKVLMTLPSAKVDWTPCSEGLPDVGERCLVTLSNDVVAIGTLHSDGECEDDFGYIVKWGQRWHLEPSSMMIAYPKDSVVAWAPRPKPYREDGEA